MVTPQTKRTRLRSKNSTFTLRGLVAATILLLFPIWSSRVVAQELRAEQLYHWEFSHANDGNSDRWPDEWQRVHDRDHPNYIEMGIVPRDLEAARTVAAARNSIIQFMRARETGNWNPDYIAETTPPVLSEFLDATVLDSCIEVRMDGGSGELLSPVFPMDPRFSYRLLADISTENLDGHQAWAELQLLDGKQRLLDAVASQPVLGTANWKTYATPAESPTLAELQYARVHLKVESLRSRQFAGTAKFDNIKVYRIPRLSLSSRLHFNVGEPGQSVDITCSAMGIRGNIDAVNFELHDVMGQLLDSGRVPLKTTSSKSQQFVSNVKPRENYARTASFGDAYDGKAVWRVKVNDPGLYRVTIDIGRNSKELERPTLLLAIIDESQEVAGGPFGWSIQRFGFDLTPSEIPEMVQRFGAGWLKFPIWYDMEDEEAGTSLIKLIERLQAFGVKCVGRFDEPPLTQRSAFSSPDGNMVGLLVFREKEVWEPLLEPVLTRMGIKINWFQLGADDDQSFMHYANANQLIGEIRGRMQNYSLDLKLALAWDWLHAPPEESESTPWSAIQYSTAPDLTAGELVEYSKVAAARNHDIWINLDPLPASKFSLLDRVRDLTERMIEVRKRNIGAAFITNPFDQERGLFSPNKKAGELLIPWHTLVSCVGVGGYVGSINLPNGSINHTFANRNGGTMLVWNNSGTIEQLYLGDEISATDIWGKPILIEIVKNDRGGIEHRIPVSKWPLIVHGVNENIVRLRQDFQLQITNLASQIGGGQFLPVSLESPFEMSISGQMHVHSETLLGSGNEPIPLSIAGHQTRTLQIPIEPRTDASAGEHQLRFDFEIEADRRYVFSIYRSVVLGLGEFEFRWEANRLNDSRIELRVELINNTDEPVSFDCKVFPVGLPYSRFSIMSAPPGSTQREFQLNIPGDREPAENWIRCEGIDSVRLLNYRVKF